MSTGTTTDAVSAVPKLPTDDKRPAEIFYSAEAGRSKVKKSLTASGVDFPTPKPTTKKGAAQLGWSRGRGSVWAAPAP